jgi:ABC-2 type transport system ATP-binding protein
LRAGASKSDGYWVFRLAGFDEIEYLLAGIRQAGCTIEDLRLTQTDLEDVFVGVMREEIVSALP